MQKGVLLLLLLLNKLLNLPWYCNQTLHICIYDSSECYMPYFTLTECDNAVVKRFRDAVCSGIECNLLCFLHVVVCAMLKAQLAMSCNQSL